ncbi:MAG TPA: FHA domain-containing protein [Vicinamibacterales bacterium]|nr:FHA domain-containing protein [Vicinamibacterales bacterium]
MPKLVVKFDERVLAEYPVDSEMTIGRLPDNAVVIDNPAVSGHHARIFLEGDHYVVEDLRSKNGTYVNEQHVVRGALRHRDVLLIGKHKVVFDAVATAEPVPAPRRTPALGRTAYLNTRKHRELLARLRAERARARSQSEPSAKAQAAAFLRVVDGQTDHQEYWIHNPVSFIGSSEEALVRLQGWLKPRTAAAIVQNDAGFTVTDFDGRTLVNNQCLPDGSQQLKDGDMLEAGGLVMRFGLAVTSPAESGTEPESGQGTSPASFTVNSREP